jgi:hypothetical protein
MRTVPLTCFVKEFMDFLQLSLLLWRFITIVTYTIGNYMYRSTLINKSDKCNK